MADHWAGLKAVGWAEWTEVVTAVKLVDWLVALKAGYSADTTAAYSVSTKAVLTAGRLAGG